MARIELYLSGVAKWAKVQEPDQEYNKYSVDLYLDDTSEQAFDTSGLQLLKRFDFSDADSKELKPDQRTGDGPFVKLARPTEVTWKGELKTLTKPLVLDEAGALYEGLIGNGSAVTCKVEVYDTKKGKGHRLLAVRVDELVEYEGVEVVVIDGALTGLPF